MRHVFGGHAGQVIQRVARLGVRLDVPGELAVDAHRVDGLAAQKADGIAAAAEVLDDGQYAALVQRLYDALQALHADEPAAVVELEAQLPRREARVAQKVHEGIDEIAGFQLYAAHVQAQQEAGIVLQEPHAVGHAPLQYEIAQLLVDEIPLQHGHEGLQSRLAVALVLPVDDGLRAVDLLEYVARQIDPQVGQRQVPRLVEVVPRLE